VTTGLCHKRMVTNRCKAARVGATKVAVEAGLPASILEFELKPWGYSVDTRSS
jgi:hypothetical protein